MRRAASKLEPPDRIGVGWCPKCGALGSAIGKGMVHAPYCMACPGNERIVVVRYMLARRRGRP